MLNQVIVPDAFGLCIGDQFPDGIKLVVAENENMQSKFVVQKVLELREQNVPLDEIAVLFVVPVVRCQLYEIVHLAELGRRDIVEPADLLPARAAEA